MKRILNITLFVLFVVAISTLMGFIAYEHSRQNIRDIKINIPENENSGFLNDEIIRQMVLSADSIKERTIRNLEMRQLEDLIGSNPFVDQVDAYIGINLDLILNVSERESVLRVYLPDNRSFYLDKNGYLFPLCTYYTPRTLVANGYIRVNKISYFSHVSDSMYAGTELPELHHLAMQIKNNSFLKSLVSQVYVNSKGEYDLIPELGQQTIRLGSLRNLDEKLRNLEAFYKKKLPKEGWEKYETINLMYENQIVCKKK